MGCIVHKSHKEVKNTMGKIVLQGNKVLAVELAGKEYSLQKPLAIDDPKFAKLTSAIDLVEAELGLAKPKPTGLEDKIREIYFTDSQKKFLKLLAENERISSPKIQKALGLSKGAAIAGIRQGLTRKARSWGVPELAVFVKREWNENEGYNEYWIDSTYKPVVKVLFG